MKAIPLLLAALTGLSFATGQPQQLASPDQIPEGLAKSDWSSIRAAYEAGRHAIHRQENGTLTARNPGQQWRMEFDGKGFTVTPDHGQWTWGLELTGYGERTLLSASSSITHDGGKITSPRDENLTEWFINDTRGLEQGWTIHSRSVGVSPTSAFTLTMSLRGDLKPQVSPDSSSVSFQTASGASALTYGGLKAWDADGKILPVRFEDAGENQIRIAVDEKNARYPLTIDPIAQQAYLKSGYNGAATDDHFGSSVSVSGDTVVVGANLESSSTTGVNSTPNESASHSGAVYVFVRSGTNWSQQAYLKASNTGADDEFGSSVSVSGDTVVVGAWQEASSTTGINSTPNESAVGAGAAYVFTRSGTTWSQQAYLKGSNTGSVDNFGGSVSVSGDTVVVGAPLESSSTTGVNSTPNENGKFSGAAYVFVRSGTDWSEQAYLKASNTGVGDRYGPGDQFGASVSVFGDTVVVGAPEEDSSTTGVNSTPNETSRNTGAAYVFERIGTNWSEQAYLKASNTGESDQFGGSVAVSGDTVVVGARYEASSTTGVNGAPNESAAGSGAAYVFVRSGTNWNEQAYLKASNTGASDSFGASVSVSGDTVVVGANGEDSNTTGVNSTSDDNSTDSGAAYVFVRSGTSWSQQSYLKAGNTGAGDRFGGAVAVSGDTVVVGAPNESSSTTGVNSAPNESAFGSGAAYVFERSGTNWTEQAYLKASNTGGNPGVDDRFGSSVAISGDTVVVAVSAEDSSTTGVNSTPDESGLDSGAVYVFVRSGALWSQQAYLKASNTGANDNFGSAVAISGDTIVVGAGFEDSSTTGVNSAPNESATKSGAAYVFVRSGTDWSQQAYLKAGNTGAGDWFGESVAISGDTVVVGAYGEDSSTTGVNRAPNESATQSGAAYVFVRSGTNWSQQAYLKANNTGASDFFGYSVSVSGDTVVVGAYQEDSSTTGVNSTPNESASGSGAAYVFVRSGTDWGQQAYLKANNTGAGDRFGESVAISGDTVVAGAPSEDSSTTGVNSIPNEIGTASGAAYGFVRTGTNWTQQAYLKAGHIGGANLFGKSVAVSGDTVVVGASNENSSTTGVNSTPNLSALRSGAAYVFLRDGMSWSQQAYLKASNTGVDDLFGSSVAVYGDTVVVGAPNEDSSTTGVNSTPDEDAANSGAAYIFTGLGPVPTLTGISPSTGGTAGGTNVILTGTNFAGATAVSIGGIPAAGFTVTSNTSITATTPAHLAGAADVVVTTPLGTAVSSLFTFLGQEIAIEQPGSNDPGIESSTVDFGPVLTSASASRTLLIRNTGNLPLGGLAVSIVGSDNTDFVAVQPIGSVNGGESTSFSVNFTPAALGARTATLLVASDDEDENLIEIELTGTGSTPQQLLNSFTTTAGLIGDDAQPGAIPFDDGVENLLKYAFNMNLSGPDMRSLSPTTGSAGLPSVGLEGSGADTVIRVEFLRRKGSGLVYTPKRSSTLVPGSFVAMGGTPVVTSIDANWERVVVVESTDPETLPQSFAIVEVSIPQ